MAKITYEDKEFLNKNENIADKNKVNDTDLNEIKNIINENDNNIGNLSDLNTTNKDSLVGAINEVNSKEEVVFDYIVNTETNIITYSSSGPILSVGEQFRIYISGSATAKTDVYTLVDGYEGLQYYQMGNYFSGELISDGTVPQTTGYRAAKNGFYYGHAIGLDISRIFGTMSFQLSQSGSYYPFYEWKTRILISGQQLLSDGFGWLNVAKNSISSLTFKSITGNFRVGTKIRIIKEKANF